MFSLSPKCSSSWYSYIGEWCFAHIVTQAKNWRNQTHPPLFQSSIKSNYVTSSSHSYLLPPPVPTGVSVSVFSSLHPLFRSFQQSSATSENLSETNPITLFSHLKSFNGSLQLIRLKTKGLQCDNKNLHGLVSLMSTDFLYQSVIYIFYICTIHPMFHVLILTGSAEFYVSLGSISQKQSSNLDAMLRSCS